MGGRSVKLWRTGVASVYPGLGAEKGEDEGELAKDDARQLGGYRRIDAGAPGQSVEGRARARGASVSLVRAVAMAGPSDFGSQGGEACGLCCDVLLAESGGVFSTAVGLMRY